VEEAAGDCQRTGGKGAEGERGRARYSASTTRLTRLPRDPPHRDAAETIPGGSADLPARGDVEEAYKRVRCFR
jgi:hypothetical protein